MAKIFSAQLRVKKRLYEKRLKLITKVLLIIGERKRRKYLKTTKCNTLQQSMSLVLEEQKYSTIKSSENLRKEVQT